MADDAHTPTLLGLPTELLIMVAKCLSLAEGICNLRSTCYDIAMRVQDEFASRVALPITMDDEGCQTLQYAITSNNARLPSLAPQITRIRLADLGHATSGVAYCRNVDIEPFQNVDVFSHYIDENEEVAYHGYRQHGPCLVWAGAMPFMEPTMDSEGVTKVAQLLPSFPKLTSIGTWVRRTELHVLYNSENPFVLNNAEIFGRAGWYDSMEPPKDEWSQQHQLIFWDMHYLATSRTDYVYHNSYVRPAYLDLLALEAALSKHTQMSLSKILTRLSITSRGTNFDPVSVFPNSRSAEKLCGGFVRGCTNLERLRIKSGTMGEGMFYGDEWGRILGAGALAQLTYLKVEGGVWDAIGAYWLIKEKAAQLKFFYFRPTTWEFNPMNTEHLTPLMDAARPIDRVVIDLGPLGLEQWVDGRGFVNLEKRIEWRDCIIQEHLDDPHEIWYLDVDTELDDELRGRVGGMADGRDDDPRETAEEAQTLVDRRRELLEEFEAVEFD